MWNPFKLILQSPKALNTIVTGGMEALDHRKFTDEERAEGRKAMLTTVTAYMEKTTGQDVTRRSLALMAAISFFMLAWVVVLFLIFEEPAADGNLYRAGLLIQFIGDSRIGWAFMLVMLFYFAPHLLAKYLNGGRGNG